MAYEESPKLRKMRESFEKGPEMGAPPVTIDAKYGKKGSDYKAGQLIGNPGGFLSRMAEPKQPVRVPAIEESLYTEDDLG